MSRSPLRRARTAVVLVVALAATVLAGCSSAASTRTDAASGEPSTTAPPATVASTIPAGTVLRVGEFVNPGFTSHIKELTRPESDALLQFLYDHSVEPEFVVRYHWHDGDVGFWDNRATQHAVAGDFGTGHRVIQRVTLRGDEPV